MERYRWGFDQECERKCPEDPTLGDDGSLPQFAVGDLLLDVNNAERHHPGGMLVHLSECDDSDEHQNRSGKESGKVLDRYFATVRSTPVKDQKCHRYEREFEEGVEQDEIKRTEDPKHCGLKCEKQTVVSLGSIDSVGAYEYGDQA